MPFKIVSRGNKYAVVTTATGKVHGVFPHRSMAEAQLRALYANVKDVRPPGDKADPGKKP